MLILTHLDIQDIRDLILHISLLMHQYASLPCIQWRYITTRWGHCLPDR